MNKDQALRIYECLVEKDRLGIPVLQISRETNIPSDLIRRYLSEFSSFFTRVGNSSRYTVNRFSNKSKDSLVAEINQHKREKASAWVALTVFCCALTVAISTGTYNGS